MLCPLSRSFRDLSQVTFKRRETARAVAARKRSHAYLQKQSAEEPWVSLEPHAATVSEAGVPAAVECGHVAVSAPLCDQVAISLPSKGPALAR